jgi:hypothetical protein
MLTSLDPETDSPGGNRTEAFLSSEEEQMGGGMVVGMSGTREISLSILFF